MPRLVDLSHHWHADLPPFPGYTSPVVRWIKRMPENRIYSKFIETNTHNGTHIDAPIHYVFGGKDLAAIPLEQLYGPAAVVDLSDIVDEWSIYDHKVVTDRVEVKERDILIIHTGWHHYYHPYGPGCRRQHPEPNETKYFFRHPGPNRKFAEWALRMKLKWVGVDTGSADHPMNTSLRYIRPDLLKEFEELTGKPINEIFPPSDFFIMHQVFAHDLIHAENVGGDIDQVLNRRVTVGAFAWKFIGGDASPCRIVAFVEE